jgi:chloride channel protein, CIC family
MSTPPVAINAGVISGAECALERHAARDSSHDSTIVREDDIAFDVIHRIWHRGAWMALVTCSRGVPRAEDVAGIITKEHIADSVARSVKVYSG